MKILLLRFDSPLMSFGAPIIDENGVIQPFPSLSMITGMLANALGFHHKETDRIQSLQKRIRYACRRDMEGKKIRDYQTVNLGQDFMVGQNAWTTRSKLEERKGGSASSGTHIRQRDFWVDSIVTVALSLEPEEGNPRIQELKKSLLEPERPLFIGRKTCLPAAPVFLGLIQTESLLEGVKQAPLPDIVKGQKGFRAWWPTDPSREEKGVDKRPVTDGRDWANQIHTGERWVAQGLINISFNE